MEKGFTQERELIMTLLQGEVEILMPDYTKRPGYSPAIATLKPLRQNASRQLSKGDKVTARRLEDFGISHSDAYEVRIAWRHLKFVNEQDDCVTETYDSLAHASEDEFKLLLGKVLRNAYSGVFSRLAERGVDLEHVTQQELRDIFRDCQYEPVDMQSKMITLFRGLCREAVFEPDLPQESGQKVTETQTHIASKDKASTTLEGNAPMTEPAPARGLKGLAAKQDDSMIVAYLDALEVFRQRRKSPDWTEVNSSNWREAVAGIVDLLQKLLS